MPLKDHLSHYREVPTPAYPAGTELRVSPDGEWKNLEAALKKVAELRASGQREAITVRVAAAEYRTPGIEISEEMNGKDCGPLVLVSEPSGWGKRAVLNGGVRLHPEDFVPVSGEIRDRLHGEAKDKVVVADLKAYGLSRDDWGGIYPVGSASTARKYDDAELGTGSEVFFNNKRMTLARWPNKGNYSCLDEVADVGDCGEFPPQNYYRDWHERRNHRGGTYILSRSDNDRVASWGSREGVWMFGYFFWDWADSSTPVTFDITTRRVFPKYVSFYAARKGADFYFYNVLDELDEPGEYWIDREKGLLYLFPDGDLASAKIEMSVSVRPVVTVKGASGLILDGFDFCNVRNDAVVADGNDLQIRDCTVTNVAGNGIVINGYRNRVERCEVSHTGRGGIILSGGDRASLTRGESVIENNSIHHFAEIYMTYAGGLSLGGIGNRAAHNEIYHTPHAAIFYSGNDHLIEYNYIHDAVLYSGDAGAIYSGLDWSQMGTVIRWNVLDDIGSDGKGEFGTKVYKPQGIYWDDGLSGQTAYGNFLRNIGQDGFACGGGFDCTVRHNLMVDVPRPLSCDARFRDGLLRGGWAHTDVETRDGRCWQSLLSMPVRSPQWKEHYPVYAKLREDLEDRGAWDDPWFPVNPARCVLTENVILKGDDCCISIDELYAEYSRPENNPEYEKGVNPGFVDPEDGDYRILPDSPLRKRLPDFPDIPFSEIGRY